MYTYHPSIVYSDAFHNHIQSGFASVSYSEDGKSCVIRVGDKKKVHITATGKNTYNYTEGTGSITDVVVNFAINDDATVTLIDADYWGRHLKSENNLKQFEHTIEYFAWAIITDRIVRF